MTEVALKREINLERILLHELTHRINNEFSSLIGAVSRTAARSVNHEVKIALAHVIELLYHYGELHHALQMPENDTLIDASAYLENLCLAISRSKLVGTRIDLVLTASPLRLPSELCWRLGMIVYEAGTDAAQSMNWCATRMRAVAGDQPYILEFSAGNAGPDSNAGQSGDGKNVIATGACETFGHAVGDLRAL